MGTKHQLAIISVLSLALAGCAGPTTPNCPDAECPTSTTETTSPPVISRPPDVTFPPIPVNETLRSIQFENCVGFSGSIPLPKKWLDESVPPEFRPGGTTPATADITVDAVQCARIVLPNKILEDQYQLLLAPWTHTRNDSWEPIPGPSWYLFDAFVSSPELALLYNSWGFPTANATFEVQDILSEPSRKAWTVTHASTQISFDYQVGDEPTQVLNGTAYLWTGTDPFLRATESANYTHLLVGTSSLQQSTVHFEGPSRTASVVTTPTAFMEGHAYARIDYSVTVDPEIFYGGNE